MKEKLKKLVKKYKENLKPDCLYVGKCLSEGWKCATCANNKKFKNKKDYYKPKVEYTLPW